MSTRPLLTHPAVTCALIVAIFYLVPVEPGVAGVRLVLRGIGSVLVLLLVAWLVSAQIRRQIAAPQPAGGVAGLAVAIVAGLVIFALADYVIAISGPDQFASLRTKTDALYFALATLATVGYGDIHPSGQLAKVVVMLQMAFNLVVLATGASIFIDLLTDRIRKRSAG
ncbi:potassium channel family protein [Polymorphospora rubra]|uniref:Membrane protein n=1 Tax=Polymorphospora rubra TaxID=338584 RepID=A0A810N702_9ACTN|nr:potassium channel family protein [Polymorphospora rubra]BCJ67558.1 membrane protein [Polymorphospora rubra]